MIRSARSPRRLTTSVKRDRGFDESQNESMNSSPGNARLKKRSNRDSLERDSKKAASAPLSSGRATPIDAVVPSRKIRRPDSGASW